MKTNTQQNEGYFADFNDSGVAGFGVFLDDTEVGLYPTYKEAVVLLNAILERGNQVTATKHAEIRTTAGEVLVKAILFSQEPESSILVCLECDGVQEIKYTQHDHLTVCPNCQSVEGKTEEISLSELERRLTSLERARAMWAASFLSNEKE